MQPVTITYCKPCGYLKRAAEVANAIEATFGIAPALVPGGGGIFEVRLGEAVVARRTKGHFPGPDEIVAAIHTITDSGGRRAVRSTP
jgi:selenoprotein W-related protein